MEEVTMKKSEIIAKLQTMGVDVNPGLKKEALMNLLQSNESSIRGGASLVIPPSVAEETPKAKTDTERILEAVGGLASTVDALQKRVTRMEVGGKDDFKMDMKTEDVQSASRSKEGLDQRIVKIVEDTLGIDFGIEVKPNGDRPGFELTILVPRRLSNVPTSFRPVRDEVTGQYKVDEKTKRIVEEEYWPEDRRSMQLGSTASYEMIQDRCNRIRAFILSWYQKMNKPQPEFKLK